MSSTSSSIRGISTAASIVGADDVLVTPPRWAQLYPEMLPDHNSVFVARGEPYGVYIAGNSGAFCACGQHDFPRERTLYLSDEEAQALASCLARWEFSSTRPVVQQVVQIVPDTTFIDEVSNTLDALIVAARYGTHDTLELAIERTRTAIAALDALAEKQEEKYVESDKSSS